MNDFYEDVRLNPCIDKLEIGDFLFAQFTCGVDEKRLGLWSHTDYLMNVVTGKKTWHTANGDWVANPGETLFFKKGALIINQHFIAVDPKAVNPRERIATNLSTRSLSSTECSPNSQTITS